jgi:hypothetical protein
MQNKKLIFIMAILTLVVGAAAFIGGRMLNQKASPVGLGGPPGSTNNSVSVQIIPAKELPKTPPEVRGSFVERKDNTIVVTSAPLETGGGGVVVDSQSSESGDEESLTSKEMPSGPQVEVVVTSETIIYRDATDFSEPPTGENQTIQEIVGEGTLDDLSADSMIRVWGRKSGDRIIAEILFYSSPVVIKRPG